ncbi:hypothetical protein RhiirA5_359070 [Rhizophagus irregularis]|uniref:Uncharacterized protein n=2 Tax=Rhizophagus irregularis TaxID=588596 RepID=A0A2N0PL23_9GLOM|nr:hypothetical protein RhiirA5_359070 [Rhizophagus irregularis]
MKTSRNKTSRNITRQEGHINWMLNSQDPNPLSFFRHICPANRVRAIDKYRNVLNLALENTNDL